jgi:predicted amidohydrolase YtcJ
MLDAGVPLVFSSDAPVVWPDWRQGVAAAVLRTAAANGVVYGPEERITVEEAIAAYTSGGAWQDFAEGEKGTVEPGKLADLVVVDGDPLADCELLLRPERIWLVIQLGEPVAGAAKWGLPPFRF